jgi:hypothetical protein
MSFELFEFQLGTLKLTYNLCMHNLQISIVHHDHIAIFAWFNTHIIVHRSERSNFSKRVFNLKSKIFVLTENSTKQFVLTTQGILKFVHFRREIIVGEIITYIGVGVRVVLRRSSLGHKAQLGEVAFLLLVVDLLIVF